MGKITPGPWTQYVNRDGSISIIGKPDADGESVKVALVNNRNEANAQIIVAVPDLLEAAREAQAILADLSRPNDKAASVSSQVYWARCVAAEHKLRDLIAKVTGAA